MNRIFRLITPFDNSKGAFDQLMPFSLEESAALASYDEDIFVRFTHGSNVVPANPLKVREYMSDLVYAFNESSMHELLKVTAFHVDRREHSTSSNLNLSRHTK